MTIIELVRITHVEIFNQYLKCYIKENVFYLQYIVLIIIYKDTHIYIHSLQKCPI